MSAFRPYLIEDENANGRVLHPLPIDNTNFKEEWLQKLLDEHPDILPMDEFDDRFGPLISIGRELGNIDNLFINPDGLLTIVETKLWRNPEAHRKVVSQILDYAKMLTEWSYEKLNDEVNKYHEKNYSRKTSLYELVFENRESNISEPEFIECVQTCLDDGEFALLIVGDTIFSKATDLAEMIQSAPHLQFTMGFIELKCHKLNDDNDWPMVVVPRLVSKTNEVTRSVVKIYYEDTKPRVDVDTPSQEKETVGRASMEVYLEELPTELTDLYASYFEKWKEAGHTIAWRTKGFSLRINWNGKLSSTFEGQPHNLTLMTENRINRWGFSFEEFLQYKEELGQGSSNLEKLLRNEDTYVNFDTLTTEEIALILKCTDTLTDAWAAKSNDIA